MDQHEEERKWSEGGDGQLYLDQAQRPWSAVASSSTSRSTSPHASQDDLAITITTIASVTDLKKAAQLRALEEGLQVPLLPAEPHAQAAPPVDTTMVGLLWYASSSFFFTGMGICAKMLGDLQYPVYEITLFRAIIVTIFAASAVIRAGDNPLGTNRPMLLLRGTLGFGSITAYFYACQLLPIADATTFTFLAPLIVAALGPFFLKEHPSAATLVAIPMCLAGVALVAQPDFIFGATHAALSLVGILVALCQPAFSAGAKMTVRYLRSTEKTNVMVLYLVVLTGIYSSILCAINWQHVRVPRDSLSWTLLIAQGCFGYGNQVCITKGLAKAKAAQAMSMQYLSIITSQVAGMWLFSEFTNLWGAAGMAIIISTMLVYSWTCSTTKALPASPAVDAAPPAPASALPAQTAVDSRV